MIIIYAPGTLDQRLQNGMIIPASRAPRQELLVPEINLSSTVYAKLFLFPFLKILIRINILIPSLWFMITFNLRSLSLYVECTVHKIYFFTFHLSGVILSSWKGLSYFKYHPVYFKKFRISFPLAQINKRQFVYFE